VGTAPSGRAQTRAAPSPGVLIRWAIIGVAGELLFTAGWILAGAVQGHGYRWIRDDISDLGAVTAPHPWLLLIPQTLAGCAAIGFALFGLRPALAEAGRRGWTGPWLAALSAVQDLSDGAFRPDCRAADGCTQAQATASWEGQVHAGVGLICILLLVISPFVLARRFRRLPDWRDLAGPSVAVGILLVIGVLGVAAAGTAPIHGLIQRVVATLGAAWGIALAVRLRRLAQRERPEPEVPSSLRQARPEIG
jgi:hypothetical protein